MSKKKLTSRQKLWLWRIGGIVATFAPIAIAVGVNHEDYFVSKAAGLSLGLGGGLALILIVLSALGKLGKLVDSGFKVTAFVFTFAILLEPIVLNLKFLSGMMVLGEVINAIIFAPQVARYKRKIDREATASVVKEALRG